MKARSDYQDALRKLRDQRKAGRFTLDSDEKNSLHWDISNYLGVYDQARRALDYIDTGLLAEGKKAPKVLIDALHEDPPFL